MNNYFKNKEQNIAHAKMVYESNKLKYQNQIAYCINNTIMYNEESCPTFKLNTNPNTKICVIRQTTSGMILDNYALSVSLNNTNNKVAALNFASYKHPGGMFMQGSGAQEESLCHISILYNVLECFNDSYYKNNKKALNKGLYLNRALYTPNVLFDFGEAKCFCDIITCAAPNISSLIRYGGPLSQNQLSEIYSVLKSRINYVLKIAASNNVDTLILGAFGCGVFRNNPYDVAGIFKEEINTNFKNVFNTVIFAIPDLKTYNTFKEVFKEEIGLQTIVKVVK